MEDYSVDGLNRIILALGSNRDKEQNMERAAIQLCAHFISVRFAKMIYTAPIDCPDLSPFLNQVAVAYTSDGPTEIITYLKQVERMLGRRPEDKQTGSIPIDIDLLQWNDRILKPEDMKRDYILSGIRSLFP